MSEKAGPTFSLQDVAEALKRNIEIRDNNGVTRILNSFEDNDTASDLINYLSKDDFRKLIELQEKANTNETIGNSEIDKYVSLSDKIARGLLCAGRTVADGINNANDAVNNIAKKAEIAIEKTKSRARTFAKCVLDETLVATDNIVNSYKHTQWFLNTVLKNQAEENENNKLSKYIYDKYGYLLVTYKDGDFDFNDAMTSYLMPQIVDAVENHDGAASQPNSYNTLEEKIKQNLSSKQVSSSQPYDYKMSPFEDIEKIVSNNLKTLQTQNNNDTFPRIILLKEIDKGIKRSRGDVSSSYDVVEEEKTDPNKNKKQKTGGKTRRKIRRNKKAKTKKRKVNKKTKKRKRKTKVNRKKTKRKTNKRRTRK